MNVGNILVTDGFGNLQFKSSKDVLEEIKRNIIKFETLEQLERYLKQEMPIFFSNTEDSWVL